MTNNPSDGGLHIDSDWKTEAAQEKERLVADERKQQESAPGAQAGEADAGFLELVNLIAMQAAIGLGGFQGPDDERIPPNPTAAKYHIDLLDVLLSKTKGNLTENEERVLSAVLQEMRMQYVQTVSAPPPPTTKETGKA